MTRCYRVRGIPLDWDDARVTDLLTQHLGKPCVESLACELHGKSQTATVSFLEQPGILKPGKTWQTRVSAIRPSRPQVIVLDDGFLGITTLFAPLPEDHKVDFIVLTGLGGHAFGSYKERGGEYMWVRDSLPYDIEIDGSNAARVMIYGYESTVENSNSFQSLEDLAVSFRNSLRDVGSKPIVYIAHSLGGLILKEMLNLLSKSSEREDQDLLASVYGIAFFGVPHDGMDITSLIPMVGNNPNRFLVESISRMHSQILTAQRREFQNALGQQGNSKVICFYETRESPTAQKNDKGEWEMTGPHAMLVSKSSATYSRRWEDGHEHTCGIDRAHSEMVKFGPQDHEYDKVRPRLLTLAKEALVPRRRQAPTPGVNMHAESSRQKSQRLIILPYPRHDNFTGRKSILESLLKLDLDSDSHIRIALFGLGGVGKTQIVIEYAYQIQKLHPDLSIFWVHASSHERFRESCTTIAQECNIPGHQAAKTDVLLLVKEWLQGKNRGRWLMIIDNADDAQLFFESMSSDTQSNDDKRYLSKYLPEVSHGTIIITTRNKQAGVKLAKGRPPVEVTAMSDVESEQLLRAKIGHVDATKDELLTLSSRLEFLPLALVQAASFITEITLDIAKYIQLLDKSDEKLVDLLSEEFDTEGRDPGTPRAVARTWIISFEQIQMQNPLAGKLLSMMSFFDWQAMPEVLITACGKQQEEYDELQLTKAVGVLVAFSFVARGKEQSLTMHRLVQLVTRKWLEEKGLMNDCADDALQAILEVFPDPTRETFKIKKSFIPHALSLHACKGVEPIKKSRKVALLQRLALYCLFSLQYKVAGELYEELVKLYRETLARDEVRQEAALDLSVCYREQERYEEATKLELKLIEEGMKEPENHILVLESKVRLASTYVAWNRLEEADQLCAQRLDIAAKEQGASADLISDATCLVLEWYMRQGLFMEAETLCLEAMSSLTDPGSIIILTRSLATLYFEQGLLAEGDATMMRLIASLKISFGNDDLLTVSVMHQSIMLRKQYGLHAEALALVEECAQIHQHASGPDHPDTLRYVAIADEWRKDCSG